MKYLYNFTEVELKMINDACIKFKACDLSDYTTEELHALDSIMSYCERILSEYDKHAILKNAEKASRADDMLDPKMSWRNYKEKYE